VRTRFQFVPKSMTLDDFAQPIHTVAFYGAHQKNLNEHKPILSAAKM